MDTNKDQVQVDEVNKPEGQQVAPTADQTNQGNKTPEELEWEKLTGGTQRRFKSILSERDELREQLEEAKARTNVPPPPPPAFPQVPQTTDQITAQQQEAVQKLRDKYGLATMEDIGKERNAILEELEKAKQEAKEDLILENEYQRLERVFDGTDGKPAFERKEVEDHMKRTGVYNPEVAYKNMYEDELFDWKLNQATGKKKTRDSGQGYTEKPTGVTATQTEPLTVETLRERLQQPDGKDWWAKNRERILPQVAQLMK